MERTEVTVPEQALYLKWRPSAFDEMVGQEHIVQTLRNSLKTGRIRHAYLFCGPRGTGKTTTARLLAKAVNCKAENVDDRPCNQCSACIAVNEGRYLDLIEIDAATHTGVDDVRDLRDKIAFSPGEGRFKVYIIDEVHRFSGSAFDALLKTLEEPPDHAVFVLATTEVDKVPQTIKSRCLQFEFRRFSMIQVADRLELIANEEGLTIDRAALELIARQGTGIMRDSISLLDQIVSDPAEHITLDVVQRILGTANTYAVRELVEALATQNTTRGLHVLNEAIDNGSDPKQFAQQVVEHLRAVLLTQTASADLVEGSAEERDAYQRQSEQIPRAMLLRAIRSFNEAVSDSKGGWQPQLPLELAFLDSLRAPQSEVEFAAPEMTTTPAKPKATPPSGEASAEVVDDDEEIEATPPGTAALIAPSAVVERWNDMLRALNRYSTSAPSVVQHFRVHRVDGNQLFMATDNDLFFGRLHGQRQKLRVIERALYDIHKVKLRVSVLLVETFDAAAENAAPPDDPLLSLGAQLGAEIKPQSAAKRGKRKAAAEEE
jgi:DNA polymerase-3 subunit gamma/tau